MKFRILHKTKVASENVRVLQNLVAQVSKPAVSPISKSAYLCKLQARLGSHLKPLPS